MIQRAHLMTDREEIIHLWQECFGDDRHYVEFFLNNCPADNALFVYREAEVIVGMMFLMPGMLIGQSGDSYEVGHNASMKVFYLYALCVDKKFRGRGIAGEMLAFAGNFAMQDNAELCLVPVSAGLRGFYTKKGFLDVFVRTEQELEVDASGMYDAGILTTDISVRDLAQARFAACGNNAFLWEEDNLLFAVKENSYSGGFALRVNCEKTEKEHGMNTLQYIIGEVDGGVLKIRETNLELSVVYRIAYEYNCDRIRFLSIKEPFEAYPMRTVPYAMMADTTRVEKFVKSIRFDKRYINFCFD